MLIRPAKYRAKVRGWVVKQSKLYAIYTVPCLYPGDPAVGGTSTKYCGKSPPREIESIGDVLELEFHTNQVLYRTVLYCTALYQPGRLLPRVLAGLHDRDQGGQLRHLHRGCSVRVHLARLPRPAGQPHLPGYCRFVSDKSVTSVSTMAVRPDREPRLQAASLPAAPRPPGLQARAAQCRGLQRRSGQGAIIDYYLFIKYFLSVSQLFSHFLLF